MKSTLRSLIALFTFFGLVRAASIDEAVVAKIVVKGDGTLFVDGKKIEARELDSLLATIKEKKGVVWYYRANPKAAPHPVAMEVMKAIIARKVPIKLFSDEAFSESIGPDGKSQKQKKS